jgi:flagellar biosynthesis/type III secretory pathway protein FliH
MPTLAEIWVQQGHEEGYKAGLKAGLKAGREETMQRGVLSGRIQMLHELLGESPAPTEELRNLDLPQLINLEQSLRLRLPLPNDSAAARQE